MPLTLAENNAVCHQLCNKPENMICCQLCNSQPEYARCSSHSGPHCSYWNTSQCPEISFSTHALEEMISKISNNICSNKIHTQTRTSPKSEWENKTVLLDLVLQTNSNLSRIMPVGSHPAVW